MNRSLRFTVYAPSLLVLFVMMANVGLYLSHQLPMKLLFNADALYLPALYQDIVVNKGAYADWYLSPAPYFFPDMPLYFLSEWITGNHYYAILLFFTLEAVLFVSILYGIYSVFLEKRHALTAVSLIFLLLYLFPVPTSEYQFVSAFHYGEFLVGLGTLYLLLRVLGEKRVRYGDILLIILFSSLVMASDKLFLLHFLLPLLLTLFLLWLSGRVQTKQWFLLSTAGVVSLIVGKAMHGLLVIHETDYAPSLKLEQFFPNLMSLKSLFLDALDDHTAGCAIAASGVMMVLYSLFSLYHRRAGNGMQRETTDHLMLFISLFTVLMLIGLLAALSLLTLPVVDRYLIPLFWTPVILIPIYLKKYMLYHHSLLARSLLLSGVAALVIYAVIDTGKKLTGTTLQSRYTTPLSECFHHFVEETGARYGIAHYWQSKNTQLLSVHDVSIAQVERDLTPFRWITSDAWYRERYDFALIDTEADKEEQLDEKMIIAINGEANSIYECNGSRILYYPNELATDMFSGIRKTRIWKASDLPTAIGTREGVSVNSLAGQKGYVTYGPYISLPAGDYAFSIEYLSSESSENRVGTWDVVMAVAGRIKLLNKGILSGTDHNTGSVKSTFTIPETYHNREVEIRNYHNGNGDLTINTVTITKVR